MADGDGGGGGGSTGIVAILAIFVIVILIGIFFLGPKYLWGSRSGVNVNVNIGSPSR